MNEDLRPDLPVIPGLRFPEEPNCDLESPTALYEKRAEPAPTARSYKLLIAIGATGLEVPVRDKRTHAELVAAWLKACNRVHVKGHREHLAHHALHAKTESGIPCGDEDAEPQPWTLDRDDLVVMGGDDAGVGSAAYPADLVKGIVQL